MEWFFPVMFLVGFIALFTLTRKETKQNSLTKKGFVRLVIGLVILFAISFSVVYLLGP